MYRVIWTGMREISKSRALYALVYAIFLSFIAIQIIRLDFTRFGLGLGGIAIVGWAIALWILLPRCIAYLNEEGWRCKECSEWIGLTDHIEAFRLRGFLGRIPESLEAFIVCHRNHYNSIKWQEAFNEMRNHLGDQTAWARGDVIILRDEKDEINQSIRRDSSEFAKKSSRLLRKNQLGEKTYAKLNDLRRDLHQYANKMWPKGKDQRDSLYNLITALTAYQQYYEQAKISMKRDPTYRLIRKSYDALGGNIQQAIFLPDVAVAAQMNQDEFGYALDYLSEQRLIVIETNDGWGRITRQGVSWMKKYEETPDEPPARSSLPPTQENTFYGPVGAVQGPNSYADVQQNIGANLSEVLNCLEIIRQRVQQLPPAEREDALQTIDEIKQGAQSPNPPRGMIKKALRALVTTTKDKVIEASVDIIFKHLGISG